MTTLLRVQKEHEDPLTRTAAGAAQKAIMKLPLRLVRGVLSERSLFSWDRRDRRGLET